MNPTVSINGHTLKFIVDSGWSEENNSGKLDLRQSRDEVIAKKKLQQFQVSTSHTDGLGGMVMCESPEVAVGFDIEPKDRVPLASLQRMLRSPLSTKSTPTHLWCSLEAAFKAFRKHRPQFLGQLELVSCTEKEDHVVTEWRFQKHQCTCHAFVWTTEDTQEDFIIGTALSPI